MFDEIRFSSLIVRSSMFLGLWVLLMGPGLGDVPVGLIAAASASWVSIKLCPGTPALSVVGILHFFGRFVVRSVAAGFEVARLAFSAKPNLAPGLTTYASSTPKGLARETFWTAMSLQPGTLPVCTDADQGILLHCLDVRQPVGSGIAADERAFAKVFRTGTHAE